MSSSSSPSSTPNRNRTSTIPRPPPIQSNRPPSPSPASSATTLSAAAAGSPRRASTPVSPHNTSSLGPGSPPSADKASRSRARDLLRKHYGLGVGPPPPLQGPGKPLDPMDIDSPAFDAKSYYEQLITTASLSTLLKRENQLSSEIRQLDSERQSLVYNHHHELIAASDTITAMKSRAENVDADLDKLRFAFSEISRLTDELSVETSRDTSLPRIASSDQVSETLR